ncbi:hypothetical protein ACE01N_07175 [Saccharicrinis sp. FJH2]|uniref:hypothetical protein n=1 Tax=Saccharicrinis sp. FJH65 TaxID=3344659 RepID=UPI0035F469DF
MKLNKFFVILFLTATFSFVYSCKSKKVPLTPEELNIEVRPGDQETSLQLYMMYIPIATETIYTENQARTRAVQLDADVIQFIYRNYSGNGITYRFWRKKND